MYYYCFYEWESLCLICSEKIAITMQTMGLKEAGTGHQINN